MMVTFISQCEKKALSKTRRVLDAYANRIGDSTWQTVITEEGLLAAKKLLCKTASKNTAVACHWIRSRTRSELIWIVGKQDKFNDRGIVPVNSTKNDLVNNRWENDWNDLPLIKCLAALAALWHDWGKASTCFQAKLALDSKTKFSGDPLRHEWVSVLLFMAFVGEDDDTQWLERLAAGDFNHELLLNRTAKATALPFKNLPQIASLVAWLIVTHHRLPLPKKEEWGNFKGLTANDMSDLLPAITSDFGYANPFDDANVDLCLEFPQGLPHQSQPWLKQIRKWAGKMHGRIDSAKQSIENGSWRLVLHHARLSLMLGDHHYSSLEADKRWRTDLKLIANTERTSGLPKQKLDEHLVGVARDALHTVQLLPAFEKELPFVKNTRSLKYASSADFSWQDKAVKKIREWRKENTLDSSDHYAMFVINMASTGQGKTFANAKVMRALSKDGDSLRYILALGLRTLTLQTGHEYRNRIGLDSTELGVLIGSKAVLELDRINRGSTLTEEYAEVEANGSESLERLLAEEIDYDCSIPEEGLTTVLTTDRDKKFLYAPVLACTIDHMMSATETKRGGHYILPCLRLMSSDLVIDEVDDFDGKDLVAIGRLIHLAGMLGRKVMLSSATIPPDLAEGYFSAYQAGWKVFASTRNTARNIGCAWIDEYGTALRTLYYPADAEQFSSAHNAFIEKRIKHLKNENVRRKGEVIALDHIRQGELTAPEHSQEEQSFDVVMKQIVCLHNRHSQSDPLTQKQISFGVVRVAHIRSCAALTEYLMRCEWPTTVSIRVMAYHSQQVLLMRSAQEKHLDEVLKRRNPDTIVHHPLIRSQLGQCITPNLIYILVATPIEEVGRDHDFDWAIVEPSSFRSIIQLAGRVLRHRSLIPESANIGILQYNFKGLASKPGQPVYCRPGYESSERLLNTHDLSQLVDVKELESGITSAPRIRHSNNPNPSANLADLEHQVTADLLTAYHRSGPEALQGWIGQCWWLTALPQALTPFRAGTTQRKLYLVPRDDGTNLMTFVFMEKDSQGHAAIAETTYGINHREEEILDIARYWLHRDYSLLLEEISRKQRISIRTAALKFGEVSLSIYGETLPRYDYSPQLGLVLNNG